MNADHSRFNHEYSPEQLMRFHLVNIAHRTEALRRTRSSQAAEHRLFQEDNYTLPDSLTDTQALQHEWPQSESIYREWSEALSAARQATSLEEPSERKFLQLQLINSSIYSLLTLIKLMRLHPPGAMKRESQAPPAQ